MMAPGMIQAQAIVAVETVEVEEGEAPHLDPRPPKPPLRVGPLLGALQFNSSRMPTRAGLAQLCGKV